MPTYQPGIPTGTVPLNVDYQNLQDNFTQLNNVYTIDHLPFTNSTGQMGYHTAIHLVPVSTTTTNTPNNQPINGYTSTPGYGQLFSAQINDGIVTDEALYFLSGGNRLTQLTRNLTPVASSIGYTSIPGGLILQWGFVNGTHPNGSNPNVLLGGDNGTIVFSSSNIAFPANCFSVWTQGFLISGPVPNNPMTIVPVINSRLSFSWYVASNSSSYNGFYWVALGN